MKLTKKHGLLVNKVRFVKAHQVVLHHTVTPTVKSAVNALKNRGLGYHYMIDKDGEVFEFVPGNRLTYHAKRHNRGTIGVSFIGGGKYGPANATQISSCIELLTHLKDEYGVSTVTGHKHVAKNGKIDPHFSGEPIDGLDWTIDAFYMNMIAGATGLAFKGKK